MQGQLKRADVIALGAILALVGMIAPVLLADARQDDAKKKCADNLRSILQSFVVYSAEHGDQYPVYTATSGVKYDASLKPAPGKNDVDATITSIYSEGLLPNSPTAPLWMMALQNRVTPKNFICPSDPFANKPAELMKGNAYYENFQDGKNLSYSAAYMWQEGPDKKAFSGAWWKNTTDSSLPILSDMAPYLGAKAAAGERVTRPKDAPALKPVGTRPAPKPAELYPMSPNHGGIYANVAFADAHVELEDRPDIGQADDNIWTVSVGKKQVPPDAGVIPAPLTAYSVPFDIVMVPTRSAKGELK